MMTTGFKIDRHQPIKRLTTYNLHCRKCHPGVEMDFFQNLQLKYKFWAVNSVTFISTLILVLVALGVEQDRIHTERKRLAAELDRKSTRLNSSHVRISYAVFCLKKK